MIASGREENQIFSFQLFRSIKKMSGNDRNQVLKESFISPKKFQQITREKGSG
jgi:hypothetical protein